MGDGGTEGGAGGGDEFAAGRVAVGGVLGQRLAHNQIDVAGQGRTQFAGGGGHFLHVCPDDCRIDVFGKGNPAGKALVKHAGQRVDVGAAIDWAVLDLLGGNVVDGAHELPSGSESA